MSLRSSLFRTKLEASPANDLFRFSLAQALWDEENWSECIEQLELCLLKRPDWMIASLLLAKVKMKTGELEDAQRILNDTVRMAREQDHEGPEEEALALLKECRG